MEKMTKRDYFNQIRTIVAGNAELVAFVDHELELLDKKNARRSTTPTKAQKANAELGELILDTMEPGKRYTVSELIKEIPALNELSNQKVTGVMRTLLRMESITRTEEKGKAYFSKA